MPSRERVPAYAELRREVAELVGEVNGEFGTPEWQPVVYMRRSVDRAELAALYSAADVAWVGPLRDGMNLVAKEYVACQRRAGRCPRPQRVRRSRPGARRGAAHQPLRRGGHGRDHRPRARDGRGVARRADGRAPRARRAQRRGRLGRALHRRPPRGHQGLAPGHARPTSGARPRWPWALPSTPRGRACILLDYDGTLVPIARRPQDAVPGPRPLPAPGRPRGDARTTVAVISGRGRADIARLVRGHPGPLAGGRARRPGAASGRLRLGAPAGWSRPDLEAGGPARPGAVRGQRARFLRRGEGAGPRPGTIAWPTPSSGPGSPTSWWPRWRTCWPGPRRPSCTAARSSRSASPGPTRVSWLAGSARWRPAGIADRGHRGRPHRRGHVRSSATSRLDHPGRPGADVGPVPAGRARGGRGAAATHAGGARLVRRDVGGLAPGRSWAPPGAPVNARRHDRRFDQCLASAVGASVSLARRWRPAGAGGRRSLPGPARPR